MPLSAIVLSKDRPAQLDLLLRSVTCNALNLVDSVSILWSSSNGGYAAGYGICEADHPDCDFYSQGHFHSNVMQLLDEADDYVMFLTDDSYFYREVPDADPCAILNYETAAICFSLRLGQNTDTCYPLRGRIQITPVFEDGGDYYIWEWRTGDGDFGYPGSLDGHIFRKKDLLSLIDGAENWWNPNTLEDVLSRNVYKDFKPFMSSFYDSVLVGIPANRTSTSHPGNRYGEDFMVDPLHLNREYLDGKRILFPAVSPDAVKAAHQEMALEVF